MLRTNINQTKNITNKMVRAILPIITFLLVGCGDWVLRGDFNNYIPNTSNAQLEGSILGKPDGDSIDNVLPPVRIIAGSPNNILQIGDGNDSGQIEFIAVPHNPPLEYRIDWDGNRVTVGSGNTFVRLIGDDSSGNVQNILHMRFSFPEIDFLINGEDDVIEPILFEANQAHSITIVLKLTSPKEVEIQFKQNGVVMSRNFPIESDVTSLTSIAFNTQPFGDYQVADIDIFAKTSE